MSAPYFAPATPAAQGAPNWLYALSGALSGGLQGLQVQQQLSSAKQDKADREEARKARLRETALQRYNSTGLWDENTLGPMEGTNPNEQVTKPEDTTQKMAGDAIRGGATALTPTVVGPPGGALRDVPGSDQNQIGKPVATAPEAASPDQSQFNTVPRYTRPAPGVKADYKMSKEYLDLMAGVNKRNPLIEKQGEAEEKDREVATEQSANGGFLQELAAAGQDEGKINAAIAKWGPQMKGGTQQAVMLARLRPPPAQQIVTGQGGVQMAVPRTAGTPTAAPLMGPGGKPVVKPMKVAGTGVASGSKRTTAMTNLGRDAIARYRQETGDMGQVTPEKLQGYVATQPDLQNRADALKAAAGDWSTVTARAQFKAGEETPAQAVQRRIASRLGGGAAGGAPAAGGMVKSSEGKSYNAAQWKTIRDNPAASPDQVAEAKAALKQLGQP